MLLQREGSHERGFSMSFSDFICTFAMPCYDFRLFSNCNTKVSENSDMTKSWATFCCSGTYK